MGGLAFELLQPTPRVLYVWVNRFFYSAEIVSRLPVRNSPRS